MSDIRVLHLIPSLGGGGAERQLPIVVGGLVRRGFDTHVGYIRGGPHLPSLAGSGASLHQIATTSNYDPRLITKIMALIRRVQPDVVQTWLTQMDVLGGFAALALGKPWIISERNSGKSYSGSKSAARRLLAQRSRAVIANSQAGLAYWRRGPRAKFCIPNAVDLPAIDAVAPKPLDLGGSKLVLFAGRLETQKNIGNVIAALNSLVRKEDAVAIICGKGGLEQAQRARVEAAGCSDRIRFMGFSDDLWSLMKRADVLVAPSWYEGNPNVVLEAAACGCPVVVSDIPEFREFLDDSSACFVDPAEVTSIANAIRDTLHDPEAARLRARNARQRIERMSVDRVADAYAKVYAQVLA